MKKTILAAAATALFGAYALTSCNTAPDLKGTWRAESMPVNVENAFGANTNDVITFTPSENDDKLGTIEINSTVSLSMHAGTPDQLVGPYETNVAAISSINGSWAYSKDEDDEIDVVLDYNTLKLSVDPESVQFTTNLEGVEQAKVDSLKANVVATVKANLTNAMTEHYRQYTKIEDISKNGNMIKAKLDGVKDKDVKIVLTNVNANQ